jgi:DNA-binding response OmpR family regulator
MNDAEECIKNLKQSHFDVVLVNPEVLPQENIVRKIRQVSNVPVIVLSTKNKETDIALHLEEGADDFIPIPFSKVEVVARIKSLHRRANGFQTKNLQEFYIHPYMINANLFEVFKDNKPLKLTKGEFNILLLLASNPNKVFTKEEIYNRIWKDDYYNNQNGLNVHIFNLRKKLEINPKKPKIILTKWGIGFQIGPGYPKKG